MRYNIQPKFPALMRQSVQRGWKSWKKGKKAGKNMQIQQLRLENKTFKDEGWNLYAFSTKALSLAQMVRDTGLHGHRARGNNLIRESNLHIFRTHNRLVNYSVFLG